MEQQAGFVIFTAVIVGGIVILIQAALNAALVWLHLGKPKLLPQATTATAGSKTITVKPAFYTGTGGQGKTA